MEMDSAQCPTCGPAKICVNFMCGNLANAIRAPTSYFKCFYNSIIYSSTTVARPGTMGVNKKVLGVNTCYKSDLFVCI